MVACSAHGERQERGCLRAHAARAGAPPQPQSDAGQAPACFCLFGPATVQPTANPAAHLWPNDFPFLSACLLQVLPYVSGCEQQVERLVPLLKPLQKEVAQSPCGSPSRQCISFNSPRHPFLFPVTQPDAIRPRTRPLVACVPAGQGFLWWAAPGGRPGPRLRRAGLHH